MACGCRFLGWLVAGPSDPSEENRENPSFGAMRGRHGTHMVPQSDSILVWGGDSELVLEAKPISDFRVNLCQVRSQFVLKDPQ